ncbi:MAG: hypothetical protein HYV26_21980, partial [Candidatus Hydrogenedentes bacterium]|nr:hypothetical protein [Candidatus Hydrogenedentota bacterium]
MGIIDYLWNGLLGIPVEFLGTYLHFDVFTPWKVLAWKVFFLIVCLGLLWEVKLRFQLWWRKRHKEELMEDVIPEKGVVKDQEFAQKIQAMHAPEQTLAALKRRKEWVQAGEVYAALNRNKEAAKMFQKAKDKRRAAMEWAKAGKTVRAARILARLGDYATAARFYSEKGKHLQAARAYAKLNDLPNAADAYAQAKKYPQAAELFQTYFRNPGTDPAAQLHAAERCYAMFQLKDAREKIPADSVKPLLFGVAERFEAGKRDDLAAQLFVEVQDFARAGQIYLRINKLERAVDCMTRAGKPKEASEILGKHFEGQQQWRPAAAAYEKAEKWLRAGDCHSKALDPVQAAQAYEKGGEFFGAGFALIHADKWESAIRMLQRVPETHKNYSESRALLGRCFYELKDYAHCHATLENHLMGERVRTGNIEYFWMLALAYEQEGELDKSRDVLLKIRSVNVGFRDVAQRLSSIQSRISMLGSKAGVAGQ